MRALVTTISNTGEEEGLRFISIIYGDTYIDLYIKYKSHFYYF